MRSITAVATALSLGSTASAAVAKTCPTDNVCYSLSIPETTASSGNGDIYFQLSAPTTYEYVALGQGSQMANSNIFVMYTSSTGSNVTVSPRLGTGHVEPEHDTAAQITMLDGSGVSNGIMTANVKCINCQSWQGGSMDFTGSSGSWIWAYKSGSSLDSDSLSEGISQHDDANTFSWDLSQAKGGSDVNPFTSSAITTGSGSVPASCTPVASTTLAAPSGSGCPTSWPSQFSTSWPATRPTWAASCFPSGYPGGPQGHGPWPTSAPKAKRDDGCPAGYSASDNGTSSADLSDNGFEGFASLSQFLHLLRIHAVLACLAFVGLFPIGGIMIRIANFKGLLWVHAVLQCVAFLIYLVAFGLGIYMATKLHKMSQAHPIIGISLFFILLGQPLFGYLHHRLFKKYGHRTFWSYAHLWHGRVAIILGMINGGLGLQLAGHNTTGQIAAYAAVTAVMGILYLASILIGERRRKRAVPPTYEKSQQHYSRDVSSEEAAVSPPPPPPQDDHRSERRSSGRHQSVGRSFDKPGLQGIAGGLPRDYYGRK